MRLGGNRVMTPSFVTDAVKNGYINSVLASPKQPLRLGPPLMNRFFVLAASPTAVKNNW